MRAKEAEMPETNTRPADEPCKCGRYALKHWWASITDAGNEGTDYKRHSRDECITKTERDAARRASEPTRCTCAAIQAADPRRHFRECPLRAEHPHV